jgi:eukaryotic-like serine/threonine-protein kinase
MGRRGMMAALRDLIEELRQAKLAARQLGGDHAPRLGRLVILDRIGAGAMGTVFAAYDPRLDRKVAVKVLRSSDASARVRAEARALAKLAHPNVVAVYDADEVDGIVYIVMELAPGVPLRAWIGGRHGWEDVIRVMCEAGAGIAAAHAAGLVHRDIKPDNILIGEDRVRVLDFGLAHGPASVDDDGAGTPNYMAPEVLAGEPATAASDQFSFGVTFYEALYGERPHTHLGSDTRRDTPPGPVRGVDAAVANAATLVADATPCAPDGEIAATREPELPSFERMLEALRESARGAARAKPPSSRQVPARVHAVVMRALAAEPADRFPAMAELVAALGRPRRRKRYTALALATLACGTGLGVVATRAAPPDPCAGAGPRRAVVWNDEASAVVRSALADARWTGQTIEALDAAATAWETSYRRVCEATRVRGEQSDTLLDLRMRCLGRALARIDALVGALAVADPRARIAAPHAVEDLLPPARCEVLVEPGELALPADPRARSQAQAAERELDRAWAEVGLGRYREADERARRAEELLAGIEAPRVHATRLVLAAAIEARTGQGVVARTRLEEALLAAARAHAPELEVDVWARLLRSQLFGGDPRKTIEWSTFALAAAHRAGRSGAEVDGIVGEALRAAGELSAARARLERALVAEDALRPGQRAVIEMNLGAVALAAGHSEEALVVLRRARDRVLAAVGDEHPDLALYADKLAAAHRARGQLRDALRLHDRSLVLRVAAFGDDDRAVATTLYHRALTYLEGGDIDRANADLSRAEAIRTRVYGEASPRLGEILAARADALVAAGHVLPGTAPPERLERARELYARAAALDPRLELTARRAAAGDPAELAALPSLAPGETLSLDRAGVLALRVALLSHHGQADEARALARVLRDRFAPELDATLADAVAGALLAAGDRAAAAEVWEIAAVKLGNEPTRTALRVFTGLAHASETRAPAAARAAIALHQAMPALDRGGPAYDALWAISRR